MTNCLMAGWIAKSHCTPFCAGLETAPRYLHNMLSQHNVNLSMSLCRFFASMQPSCILTWDWANTPLNGADCQVACFAGLHQVMFPCQAKLMECSYSILIAALSSGLREFSCVVCIIPLRAATISGPFMKAGIPSL